MCMMLPRSEVPLCFISCQFVQVAALEQEALLAVSQQGLLFAAVFVGETYLSRQVLDYGHCSSIPRIRSSHAHSS
jgi:hypothetical protein